MAFIIKTNILQVPAVFVRDIGISVPGSGGFVTISDIRDLESIRLSRDLVRLTNDNAYGPNSSTLIVNDDSRDIPQDFSEAEIREASLEDTQFKNILIHLASSGILQGGIITRNTDTTKFNISDGYGRISNSYSDPRNPTYATIAWAGKTAIPVTNLATSDYSYILIDINGNVVQQTSAPTPDQTRDYIVLGALVHPTRVFISAAVNNQVLGYDPELHFVDFASSFGPFNIDGNVFSANGANLKIDRNSGKIFKYGANYAVSVKSPNIINTNPATSSLFTYVYQTAPNVWASTAPTTSIDPEKYDIGIGLTGVSPGNWTIQPIFMFAETSSVQIEYGQTQYVDKTTALSHINDPFNIATQINTAIFRGWLAVAQGTTGLNDTSSAVFVPAGKFGLVTSLSGSASGEINTASNIGNRGIGWYVQKLGVDLQFKNLYAASNKISVTDTPAQHSVDVDIVPGNIDHNALDHVIGGETGYHYHLSTIEYNWIHANPTGVQGFTGSQGYTGAQGYTGIAGVTGILGIDGVTGAQGLTGVIGIDGVTGIQGSTGLTGVTGIQGSTGLLGITGLVGNTGFQGATGIQGLVGHTGAAGPGVASEGVTGQFLMKASDTSYDTAWRTVTPGDVGADPYGTADNLKPRIANALSSGLLYGGNISINTNPALFDIAAGAGLVVTNTSTPTYELVAWNGFTGVVSPFLASDDSTYVAIDSTGNVLMQPEYFNNEDLASIISLGWVDHTNRVSITYYLTEPYMVSNVGVQMQTFFEALGAFNIYGNEYYDSGSGLILSKTAGSTFDNGTNYINSIKSPNILETSGETGVQFRYYYRTAPGMWYNDGPMETGINPNVYDVGVGLTGVPDGKFTVQTISYYAPNEFTDISYGQVVYDTLSAAGAALNTPIETNPYNSYDTFRSWLLVQQGCTGLSDPTQAVIVNAGRYGLISGRYGGAGAGEANTASNVGLAGVGLFDVKSGVVLHFKNINASSNKISVTNDIPNKTVNIDAVPGNIDHDTLNNVQGGEPGSRYHLSSVEYNWIHANPTGMQGTTGAIGATGAVGAVGDTGSQGVTGGSGDVSTIGVVVDGAGSPITTGSKGYRVIHGNWNITDWTLLGKETGSCVIDVKKGTYAEYPYTTGIAGIEKPTLTNQIKNQDLTLSTWVSSLSDGDIVEFVVDSASVVTKIILSLSVSRS